jgi:hypothetical protein
MSSLPFISDNWQYRCNRLVGTLPEGDPLRQINAILWRSFKEETRSIMIPEEGAEPREVSVYSVQQGPARTEAFYDWQPMAGSYNHVQRLLAAHASLRCALIDARADRVIGLAGVNLRDLSPDEIYNLCATIVEWWDSNERTYVSPFSRMASILRNWLRGGYGDAPGGDYPSLEALRALDIDQRHVIVHCGISALDALRKQGSVSGDASVGVVGVGVERESLAAELGNMGAPCHQYMDYPFGQEQDVMILLHAHNLIMPNRAGEVSCRALVEVIPDQINPDADEILMRRGVTVVPDVLCSCATDMVENWWLSGSAVPDWRKAMHGQVAELWEKISSSQEKHSCPHHDAALRLALSGLEGCWDTE